MTLNSDTTVTATFTAVPQQTLTVNKAGTGSGTVTSSPSGINCGSTCAAQFNQGTAVTLTASPTAGSTFTGWSGGGCSGTGTCQVTLSSDTTVTATFAALPAADVDRQQDRDRLRHGDELAGRDQLRLDLQRAVRDRHRGHPHRDCHRRRWRATAVRRLGLHRLVGRRLLGDRAPAR